MLRRCLTILGAVSLSACTSRQASDSRQASEFGIRSPGLGALVVSNASLFDIAHLTVQRLSDSALVLVRTPERGDRVIESFGFATTPELVVTTGPLGKRIVLGMEPGDYAVEVRYKGGENAFYVARGEATDTVLVAPRQAVVLELKGGKPDEGSRNGLQVFSAPHLTKKGQS